MGPPFVNKRGGGAGGGAGGGFGGSKVSTFKIFLSGLPDGFKNADLEPMFESYGRTIECEVFRNNFAFVHMEEEECGREAIKALNGTEVQGKKISVVESKNKEGPNIQMMKLSVKNIPKSVNAGDLRGLFKTYGRVLEAEVFTNGNGSVTLEATGDIRTAINEMNGYLIGSQQLLVEAVKVNPKQVANQAAAGGGPMMGSGYSGGEVSRGGMRGRGRGAARGGFGVPRGVGPGYGGGYYEEEYYPPGPPFMGRGPNFALGEREYYAPGQKPLLRPPQRRPMYQSEYYEDEDYYDGSGGPVARSNQFARSQQQYGYEPEESYSYDDYYNVQPEQQDNSQIGERYGYGQPPRKLAKGEPYPPPPLPVPRAPTQARADMYGAQSQFAAPGSLGGEPRPKTRGERGGRNRLTAGKVALLEAMQSAGIPVPPGHIPSLLDVRASFGPRPGHNSMAGYGGPRPRFPAGPGGPQMQSPNMMPVASRFGGPRPRQPASAAVSKLQQMALGNMSTSYPLPLFPSASGAQAQEASQGQSMGGGYGVTEGAEDAAQQDYYAGYGDNMAAPEAPTQAQGKPDIDFTADIMLF